MIVAHLVSWGNVMAFRSVLRVGIASAGAANAQSASSDLIKRGDYPVANSDLRYRYTPKGPQATSRTKRFPAACRDEPP
jgi:hypothetical protein